MPAVDLTDAQAARLLALAQQLSPPQTLAQFIDLVSRATFEECPDTRR